MRKFAVAMIAALPLVAAAQGAPVAAPPPSAAPVVQAPAVAPAAPAPAPAAVQVAPAPAAPAPQYAPAPAAAAPVQYAPPPAQYAAPAPAPPPAQYAPPPQYAPQAQYAPPAQYPPSTQGAPPQYAPQGQYAAPGQYPPQYAPQGQYPPQYGAPGPYTAPPGQYGAAPQGAYAQPNPYPQPYAPPPGCQLTCPPPAAVAAAPAAAPKPFARSSWYLGFTVGGGDGEVRMAATPTTEAKTYSLHELFLRGPSTIAFDLQLGATLTPHVLLGGELTFFGASADYPNAFGSDETRTLGITNLNAVLTLFPFERGLFLRGGLGVASATWTKDVPGVGKTRQTASGGDVAVGVGYAFWLGQRFNLAGVLDWSRQGYGGNWLESTSFWRLSLGLGWF